MAPCSPNIRTALSRGPLPRAPYKSQSTCLCGQRTRSIARNLSSSARRREPEAQPAAQKDIRAATPFDFTDASGTTVPLLRRVRIVPDSPAYFSGRPNFTDRALVVDQLYHTYSSLPRVDKPKRILWSTFADLKASLGGEPVKHSRYLRLARQLDSLHPHEPALRPAEVARALASFRRAHQPGDAAPARPRPGPLGPRPGARQAQGLDRPGLPRPRRRRGAGQRPAARRGVRAAARPRERAVGAAVRAADPRVQRVRRRQRGRGHGAGGSADAGGREGAAGARAGAEGAAGEGWVFSLRLRIGC